jgi:Flp pilus assembly protein TadG
MTRHHSHWDDGSAFVEVALVLPLLILIIIGGAELGRIAYFAIEVSNAARAGVAYAAQSSTTATNTTEIQSAAQADAPNLPTLAASASQACVCETITTSSGATSSTPITTCSGTGSTAGTQCPPSTSTSTINNIVDYVQVSTSASVTTMFQYPGIPTSFALKGFAKMRVTQN